jgi:hypothetical protein
MTGLGAPGQKLSRKRRNCDRYEVLRPKAVKKTKELRQVWGHLAYAPRLNCSMWNLNKDKM